MFRVVELKTRALNNRLVKDSFWALFGNIIAKGLTLAAGIIVARFLGKETFGEYGIIKNTLMSIAVFSTFGLGYTATKYVAEFKNSNPESLRTIFIYSQKITLLISGLMAFGLFLSAQYVADIVLEAAHLKLPLRLVSFWIVFNAITTMQIGILAGFGAFKQMARINTVVGILTFILSLILTFYWELNGALTALLISQIINWALNYQLANTFLPKKKNIILTDKSLLKDMLNFSLPVALQEAVFSTTSWLCYLLLIKYASYGDVGLYSAAMQWNAIILFIPSVLRNVVLSHLSESNNNHVKNNQILKIILLFNFVVTSIPIIIIYVFSSFISNMYGNTFQELNTIIKVAVFSSIFMSMSNDYIQAIMAKGRNWMMFYIKLIRNFGVVIVGYLLLRNLSTLNGALAISYSELIMGIIFLTLMHLVYHSKVPSIAVIKK